MLYISRVLPDEHYGVVDTDDGVEEIVTRDRLVSAVMFDKVEILGVEYFPKNWGDGYGTIGRITPYQIDGKQSGSQAKVKTLFGMDVRVYDGEITYIGINTKHMPERAKIKLSQLGQRVDWNVEIHFDDLSYKELTFVLDDNIKPIGPGPKRNWPPHRVTWDLRAVSDNAAVVPVYRYLITSRYSNPMFWEKQIIDKPDRKAYWSQMALLTTPSWNVTQDLIDYLDNYPADLKSLAPPSDIVNSFRDVVNLVKGYVIGIYYFYRYCCARVKDRPKNGPFTIDEFDWLRENMAKTIAAIEVDCGPNDKLAHRLKAGKYAFERYLKYFNPTDEVKALFVELCNRVMQYAIDSCKRNRNRCYVCPNMDAGVSCYCESFLRGR